MNAQSLVKNIESALCLKWKKERKKKPQRNLFACIREKLRDIHLLTNSTKTNHQWARLEETVERGCKKRCKRGFYSVAWSLKHNAGKNVNLSEMMCSDALLYGPINVIWKKKNNPKKRYAVVFLFSLNYPGLTVLSGQYKKKKKNFSMKSPFHIHHSN